MRLCSSFFVVQHSTCDPEVNAACATDDFVQFFVFFKKYTRTQELTTQNDKLKTGNSTEN